MNSKRFLSRLISVATALGLASQALGYVFILDDSGYVSTWRPGTISMQVQLNNSQILSDGTTQQGSVLAAMSIWNNVIGTVQFSGHGAAPGSYGLGNDVSEIVMDSGVGSGADREQFPDGVLAVTISFGEGNFVDESDIVFNSAVQWNSFRQEPFPDDDDIRRVAVHELGHVLGLDHPDEAGQNVVALMNSTVSYLPSISTIQPDDIAGARALYGYSGFVPVNDDFVNATPVSISSVFAIQSGTNVSATKEPGEPQLDPDDSGGRTVWWKWTAHSGGSLKVTTLASNFNTLLGAYTGTAVGGLTQLALNDDVQSDVIRSSEVTINVDYGTTYYFAVDGRGGNVGAIWLNFTFTRDANRSPPLMEYIPKSQSRLVGQSLAIGAGVQGSAGYTFVWKRNGQVLPNQTSSSLHINQVSLSDSGRYEFTATNALGSSRTQFNLTVVPSDLALVVAGDASSGRGSIPDELGGLITASAGGSHIIAMMADTTFATWGSDLAGQTTRPFGVGRASAVAAGHSHTIVATDDGVLHAWGGNPRVPQPWTQAWEIPHGVGVAIAVDAGMDRSIALMSDGTVVSWGAATDVAAPSDLDRVVAIAAGARHFLALTANGTVVGWGVSVSGEGTPPEGLTGVTEIAAGGDETGGHSLALKSDGTVVAWGHNSFGQATVPAGLTQVVAIAAGARSSLALRADGTVVGWGDNGSGQLDIPPEAGTPFGISAGSNFSVAMIRSLLPWIGADPVAVTVNEGQAANFSVTAYGTPPLHYQWKRYGVALSDGARISGSQSPNLSISNTTSADDGAYTVEVSNLAGSVTSASALLRVVLPSPITQRPKSTLAVEGDPVSFTVGVQSGGPFTYQWRHNRNPIPGATGATLDLTSVSPDDAGYYEAFVINEGGDVSSTVFYLTVAVPDAGLVAWGAYAPEAPSGLESVAEVAFGGAAYILQGDGTVVEWGDSGGGQATMPFGLADVVAISTGESHTLALKRDGTVVGWGSNEYGRAIPPEGLAGVVAISAGGSNSIALRANGTVVTWGSPSETSPWPRLPVPEGLKNVVSVLAAASGFFAVTSDGAVVSWGVGFSGVPPSGIADAVSVAGVAYNLAALRRDGTVVQWGAFSSSSSPNLTGVRKLAVGNGHYVALMSDGTVRAWGQDFDNQTQVPMGLGGVFAIAAGGRSSVAAYRAEPPVVTGISSNQSATVGDFVELSVSVRGTLPINVRWRRNGVDLVEGPKVTGVTTTTLVLDPVEVASAGTYDVVISNPRDSITSPPIVFEVRVPPQFVQRPLSKFVRVGQAVTFSAQATDPGAITYRWKHKGKEIAGAVGASLTIPAVAYSDAGFYEVTASNSVATSWSVFSLKVSPTSTQELSIAPWGTKDSTSYYVSEIPAGLTQVIDAAIGYTHAIALRADGTVRVWGMNELSLAPIVAELRDVVAVSAGGSVSLALKADGSVVQLIHLEQSATSVPRGLRRVVSVAADDYGILALSADGTLVNWGYGLEEPPTGLQDVVAIDVGSGGGIALKSDGTVTTWGPWHVEYVGSPAGLSNVVSIAAGSDHALALKADGTVVAWGSTTQGATEVPANLGSVVAIAAGADHSVVLKPDGTLIGWGNKNKPQEVTGTRPDLSPAAGISAAFSMNFVLTATKEAPFITTHPLGGVIRAGQTTYLSASAGGRPSPFLQWQKNGVDIPGATSKFLEIPESRPEDSGTYRLVATNSVGTAISDQATLDFRHQVGMPVVLPPSYLPILIGGSITISCPTDGATIRYTTDGSYPTLTNGVVYTGPILVTGSVTVRAMAFKEGMIDSFEAYVVYTATNNKVPIALPSHLPRGVVGSPYLTHLSSMEGDGASVWSVEFGALPSGLALLQNGEVSGTPTTPGMVPFSVKLADSDALIGPLDEQSIQLSITVDATNEVPTIATATLPDCGLSLAYSASLAGTGGNGPLKWSLASGSLPPGLTLSDGGLISGIPQSLGKRTFTVRVGDDDTITGAGDEATKELSINVVAAPRLTNVSMRAFAGAGDNTLIVGFHIAGTGQKTVLIRGVGPKLLDYNVPSVVADPRITLYKEQTVLDSNNDWDSSLAPTFANAGAFALDFGSKDAAMTATLAPGGYTIHLVNNGPVAEGLVEVYDISRDAGTRLVNVSSRLRFQPGQLAILGTAVTGGPISVLARNVGPGIAEYLVNPLDALPDPHLRLYAGQTEIAINDDWDPALLPFFGSAGAFTIDEGSKDAAIRAQFHIGGYTVHSTGNGGEGVAIIEIYESP